jgi:hypothetical protein
MLPPHRRGQRPRGSMGRGGWNGEQAKRAKVSARSSRGRAATRFLGGAMVERTRGAGARA